MTDAPQPTQPPPDLDNAPKPSAAEASTVGEAGHARFTPARPPRFWRLKRFVASFNPLPLFFGPVFHRDVRVSGRKRGTYLTRLIVLAVPTAFVALLFMSTSRQFLGVGGEGSAAARIQSLQTTAFSVAATVAWCQLITLALVAPLLTSSSVVDERTARTLSAIAASPLSAGRVIGGLFASRMLNLALLALLPLPLLLAIRTFGGLETSFVLWSFALAVCSAVALAAVGLWASTRVTRPAGGVMLSILVLIGHWAIGPLVLMLDSAVQGWKAPSTMMPLVTSPPAALLMLQQHELAVMLGFGAEQAAAINCGFSLTLAAGALLLARWNLASMIANDRVELVKQPSRRERRVAASVAVGTDTATSDAQAGHSRTVTGNPVLWREMRQSLFAHAWKRWLGIIGVVFVVLLFHALTLSMSPYDTDWIVILPSIVGVILLVLSAATMPSGAVTTELEARTWATLLTTPLGTYQILLPKVAGAMRRLWPAFFFITVHLIVCVARGIVMPGALPFALLHFVVFALFLCCTGVFFSLCSRKSAVASTLNIAMVLALWLVAPIFAAILTEILSNGNGEKLIGIGFFTNPVVIFGVGLGGLADHAGFSLPGYNSMSAEVFFPLWLVSLLIYCTLAVLIMVWTKQSFHRLATARI